MTIFSSFEVQRGARRKELSALQLTFVKGMQTRRSRMSRKKEEISHSVLKRRNFHSLLIDTSVKIEVKKNDRRNIKTFQFAVAPTAATAAGVGGVVLHGDNYS